MKRRLEELVVVVVGYHSAEYYITRMKLSKKQEAEIEIRRASVHYSSQLYASVTSKLSRLTQREIKSANEKRIEY